MKTYRIALVACVLFPGAAPAAEAAKRPNILWITCEDISPNLSCYGDKDAMTPNLDKLAKEGVRYTHAFTVAGVCAPSRSCLISGLYPSSLGSHFMRCQTKLPAAVQCFTTHLREVGYYCSNNAKQDYNFVAPASAWDESSRKAHWRNRPRGKPFFSVFNLLVTHESQIRVSDAAFRKQTARLTAKERHDPARITVPPWHPDTPVVRRDWARYHDLITAMDRQVGDLLEQLAADGLAGETIVFFFSDHGVGLPRGKRWLYDSGLRVPFLARFPAAYQHLAPGKPGSATSQLVSFVDFGPTMLSLAGVRPPAIMQGVAFLGPHKGKPRAAVFGIRDRMDERTDLSRAVRDARYKFVRNYRPDLPHAQPIEYMELMPTMREWRRLSAAGKLKNGAALFMRPTKPFEELYDTQVDPHELNNLASSAGHRAVLGRMRKLHEQWMKETGDLGLLPEAEMHVRARGRAPHALTRDEKAYPQGRILEAAVAMHQPRPLPKLLEHLADGDSAVRYWAATGLGVRGAESRLAEVALRKALADASPVVRVAAARALARLGRPAAALPVLTAALKHDNEWVRHAAVEALDEMGAKARPALAALKAATKDSNGYVVRVARHAVARLDE
jgi:uncharacterized sulfatase